MSFGKPIYHFGKHQLYPIRRVLLRDGRPVPLRQKALETLLVLVEHPGELVEKQTLMERVWPETFVEEGNLTFTIHLLRKALGDERNKGNRFIETVPRRGYRFVAPVELIESPASGHQPDVREVEHPARGKRRWAAVASAAALISILLLAALHLRAPLPSPQIVRYVRLTSDGRMKLGRLLTDGRRIYFVERTPDAANSLVSVAVAGGDPAPLPTPFPDFVLMGLSVRRGELLVGTPESGARGSALWALPTSGGAPRRVGTLAADRAAWSPDGERIAYSTGSNLYTAEVDGSSPRKLVTLRGGIDGLFWSPDGRRLRLTVRARDRDAFEVWDVGAEGGGLHRVLAGAGFLSDGSWLPDASYCLFVGNAHFGARSFIYALRGGPRFFARGAGVLTQLASEGPVEFTSQVPSPDGKRILAIGSQHRPRLMRFDARLGEFVPYLRGIPAYWASFSPGGQAVAYLSLPQHALWRARPDGSEPAQITFAPLEGDGFAWSPDGHQIALRARKPGQPGKIYLIPAEGGAPRPLTPGTTDAGIPSWSPNGKRIVFGDWPSVESVDDDRCGIHFVDLDTGKISDLPGSKSLWTSRWSPDGRYIAALTVRSRRLRLFDLRTGEWRALNSPPVNNPTWSHDGRYIYFDGTEATRSLYRVRIRDGEVERIASLEKTDGGASLAWGSGLAPDDSPLMTLDLGFTEIYALSMEWP